MHSAGRETYRNIHVACEIDKPLNILRPGAFIFGFFQKKGHCEEESTIDCEKKQSPDWLSMNFNWTLRKISFSYSFVQLYHSMVNDAVTSDWNFNFTGNILEGQSSKNSILQKRANFKRSSHERRKLRRSYWNKKPESKKELEKLWNARTIKKSLIVGMLEINLQIVREHMGPAASTGQKN